MSTTEAVSAYPTVKDEFARNYWRNYFTPEQIKRVESIREEHSIVSTGVNIHIDVYQQPQPDNAPTIVFNHGSMVYGRMFTHLALDVYDLGYNVVAADQRGQGLSGGERGDYTVSQCVENIVDVSYWAKARFPGTMFMSGGSIGGAYAYYATVAGAPVKAVAVVNLMDFGNPYNSIAISRFAWQAHIPLLPQWNEIFFPALTPLIGWLKLPIKLVGKFENVVARDGSESGFLNVWDKDPNCPRWVTYRYIASNFRNPPAVPLAENKVPILVMNQGADRMISPKVTEDNYHALGGEKKYIELVGYEHWSNHPDFWRTVVTETHNWFQQHL